MPGKISILRESGETLESNVVSVFMIPETGKRYIITTENAVDPHGLTVLHISEIVDNNLQKIATDDEWSSIKTIMRAIISGNVGSYQYLPTIESINAVGQYSRDISVSASASKQMIDNYNAADTASDQGAGAQPAAPVEGADQAAPVAAPAQGVTQPTEQQVTPSNIFPTNNAVGGGEEVVPGISEVGVSNQTANNVVPGAAPVDVNPPMAPDYNNNNVVNNAVLQQTSQIPVVNQGGMVPPPAAPMDPQMSNEVQVVNPAQMVPSGQIVQGEQSQYNGPQVNVNIDQNAAPSFDPNATLDSVVMGAQEMFMAGVRNLVQTIQEKVYRDLYNKEIELKNREIMLEQKEQMLNNQMMLLNNSYNQGFNMGGMTPPQGGMQSPPSQGGMQPPPPQYGGAMMTQSSMTQNPNVSNNIFSNNPQMMNGSQTGMMQSPVVPTVVQAANDMN